MIKLLLLSSVFLLSACAGGNATRINQNPIDGAVASAAQEAIESGDIQKSLSLTEKLYKKNPDNVDAALDYATALRMAGRETQANIVLKTFADKPGASARVLNESARIALSSGQYDQALALAKNAVQLYPENTDSLMVLAMAYDASDDLKKAEETYRTALELEPSTKDKAALLNNLALNLTLQENLKDALPLIEEALELSPSRREYKRNRAMIRAMHAQVFNTVDSF